MATNKTTPAWMNIPEPKRGRDKGSRNSATTALFALFKGNIHQGKFTGCTLAQASKAAGKSLTENSLNYAAKQWAKENGWEGASVTVRDGLCKVSKK